MERREKPAWEEISNESKDFKSYVARCCDIKNNVLCLLWLIDVGKVKWKICIPRSINEVVIWYLHDAKTAGHQGVKRTLEKAKISPFFWQGMRRTIKNYVGKCKICSERENPVFKKRHQLKSNVVRVPFERVGTDISGPYHLTDKGNKYILVNADYFSKLTCDLCYSRHPG